MKKLYLTVAASFIAASLIMGCSGKKAESASGEIKSGAAEDLEVEKYVTLGEYKGLPVKISDTTVTDEEVENSIQNTLSSHATKEEVTDRPVQDGDIVNIDYEGKKDGVAFQGGTAEGRDLTIGSNYFIPGFESGLIGAKTGETRDLNLTFPENYTTAELAGQDVVFTVTINSISEEVVPDLTDELVQSLDAGVDTVAEYRDKVREDIKRSKGASARTQAYSELLSAAQANATISSGEDLPDTLVEENKKSEKESFEKSLSMYGMDLSTYLTQQGMTEKDFEDTLEAYARTVAEQQLLVKALAKAENITVSEEDMDKLYEEDASVYGYYSGLEFKNSVKEQGAEDTFYEATLTRKVQEMLFNYAKVENPEMVTWQ